MWLPPGLKTKQCFSSLPIDENYFLCSVPLLCRFEKTLSYRNVLTNAVLSRIYCGRVTTDCECALTDIIDFTWFFGQKKWPLPPRSKSTQTTNHLFYFFPFIRFFFFVFRLFICLVHLGLIVFWYFVHLDKLCERVVAVGTGTLEDTTDEVTGVKLKTNIMSHETLVEIPISSDGLAGHSTQSKHEMKILH